MVPEAEAEAEDRSTPVPAPAVTAALPRDHHRCPCQSSRPGGASPSSHAPIYPLTPYRTVPLHQALPTCVPPPASQDGHPSISTRRCSPAQRTPRQSSQVAYPVPAARLFSSAKTKNQSQRPFSCVPQSQSTGKHCAP
ncbi:hypothetical protein B0T16DRAFT_400260 [Cercophora newfieldiana]|uniref:Uncharacterized protein n=1 Tax=Cercophora newfieldiana TaxID=92897 RepID=A0AA39YQI7_9PEZI|nr:hypothetical protein B0T16DRAFT_400260 [Cercophora newfieldiana]